MQWSVCSPESNLIENFLTIINREIYAYIRQFSSKDDLWKAVLDAVSSIEQSTIKN